MFAILSSLDSSQPDHLMFWAACTLAYFGFLRSAEFTIPSLSAFDPAIHLQLKDIAVDSRHEPSSLRVHIKASKMTLSERVVLFTLVGGSTLYVRWRQC